MKPISQRIEFKPCHLLQHDFWNGPFVPWLSDLVQLYTPSRSLRSSSDTRLFRIPTRKKKFQGQRAFSHICTVTWNQLPFSVRHSSTAAQFKRNLQTHLFRKAYSTWVMKVLICVNCVRVVWCDCVMYENKRTKTTWLISSNYVDAVQKQDVNKNKVNTERTK